MMSTIKCQLSLIFVSLSFVALGTSSALAQDDGASDEPCNTYPCAADGQTHEFKESTRTHPLLVDKRVTRGMALSGSVATAGEANGQRSGAVQRFYGEAFGQAAFSGQAGSDDIWALNTGLMVGMLPYAAKYQPESYKASVSWLTQHTDHLGKLDRGVSTVLHKLFAELEVGEGVDYQDVQALFDAAYKRLSEDTDSRIHGYLTAGIWASMAYIDSTEGIGSYSTALTGDTLGFLFRQNASEGGTDHRLADAIGEVAREVERGEKSDSGAIIGSIAKMRATE